MNTGQAIICKETKNRHQFIFPDGIFVEKTKHILNVLIKQHPKVLYYLLLEMITSGIIMYYGLMVK